MRPYPIFLALTLTALATEPGSGGPAAITSHPQSLTVLVGQPASFMVEADSATFLTYQWQHNGRNVPGATESRFMLQNAAQTASGQWRCLVENAAGVLATDPATLTVWEERPHIDVLSFDTNGFRIRVSGPVGQYLIQELNAFGWQDVGRTNLDAGAHQFEYIQRELSGHHGIFRVVGY